MTQIISKFHQNRKGFYLRTFILDLVSKAFKFKTQTEIGLSWKVDIGITGSCSWSRNYNYGHITYNINSFYIGPADPYIWNSI